MEIYSNHNYKPYAASKKAIYSQTGDEYGIDEKTGALCWNSIEIETVVIGEDDLTYVTELLQSSISDTRDKDYGKSFLFPIGFHKSRLLKWIPIQLELF
jgi:hypothetical protein